MTMTVIKGAFCIFLQAGDCAHIRLVTVYSNSVTYLAATTNLWQEQPSPIITLIVCLPVSTVVSRARSL